MGILRQTVEVIRPASTTAYSANDVIGPVSGTSLITFDMPSDRVVISGAQVMSDQNWEPTQANLYLVTSSSYAPGADNAALTVPVYADGPVTTLLMGPDIPGSARSDHRRYRPGLRRRAGRRLLAQRGRHA